MIGGISIWQLLILLVIVVLVFGTKRLRNLGGDLGSALRDFRGAMKDSDSDHDTDNSASSERAEDARLVDDVPRNEQQQTGPVEQAQQRRAKDGDAHDRD